jgi:hypothetical protein
MRSLAHGIVVVACLSACTGSVWDGTATSTSSGGQSAGSSSGSGAASSSSPGTPASCANFADHSGLASVTMHLINDTGQPILISPGPACWKSMTTYPFSILPAAGSDGAVYPGVSAGGTHTCGFRLTSSSQCEDCGGGYGFPEDPYPMLAPGGTLDLPWHGTGNRVASMPPECFMRAGSLCEWASPSTNTDCERVVAAPAGSYVVTAQAFPTCGDCTTSPCSCHGPNPVTSEPATFAFPGTSVVDVVFGPCAFGCADGG